MRQVMMHQNRLGDTGMLSSNMHVDWEDTKMGTTFGRRFIKLRILFTPCQ